jgi:hypothetical protein
MSNNNDQHIEKYVYVLIQKKYIIEVIENNNYNKQILLSPDISYQDLFEILNTIDYCTINIYNLKIPFNKIGIIKYVTHKISYGEYIGGYFIIMEFNRELLLTFDEIKNLIDMGILVDATQ